MSTFEKACRSLLVEGPVFTLLSVVRLLFLLIFGPLALLAALFERLCSFRWPRNLKEEEEDEDDTCQTNPPESVMRRPDPCIYSQQYLAEQGVAVTWNNPDIWVARADNPGQIEPDSYHLQDDTDYIVSVRCHNASTDLALGVRVRLLYRPWSFNSPDLLPVDVHANGQEVVRFVNIPGMGSAIAQFNWHTPVSPPGETQHFCLQAHLDHPLDINPGNNMGQENTNVHSSNPGHVAAGEVIDVDVPLFNHARRERRFRFDADAYAVDEQATVSLTLKRNTGREPWPLSRQLASFVPTFVPPGPIAPGRPAPPPPDPEPEPVPVEILATEGRPGDGRTGRAAVPPSRRQTAAQPQWFGLRRPQRRTITRARYTGAETYRRELEALDVSLPTGMQFATPGFDPALPLAPRGRGTVPVRLQVPGDAQTGERYSINVRAHDEDGRLMGGVTFLLNVDNEEA